MQNRLIKSGIIIAIASLVMFNAQLLFDTSESPLLQKSTVSAAVDPTRPNTDYLEHAYLKMRNCIDWEVTLDISLEGIFNSFIGFSIASAGHKYVCKDDNREIFCNLKEVAECSSGID